MSESDLRYFTPVVRAPASGQSSESNRLLMRESRAEERPADTKAKASPRMADASALPAPPRTQQGRAVSGLNAYGCVYDTGVQRLAVMQPDDMPVVCFGYHSCLKHVAHRQGEGDITVMHEGDYEVTFDVHAAAKAAAPVIFELRAGQVPLPGGTFVFTLGTGIRDCRGGTMARLAAGDRIRLVIRSASVCEVWLRTGGVSAMLCLRKLD